MMMTEKRDENRKSEETREEFGCCCPPQFREMMANFMDGDKEDCFAKIQEMMKKGGSQSE